MRTPLSSALLYASHLSTDQLDPAKRKKFTAKLRDRLQHMERQIHDILMFARGDMAGEEVISLSDNLAAFAQASDQSLQQSEVQLVIDDQSHGRAKMTGRQDALLGLFSNLLENAIQHEARKITLQLTVAREIEICFSDDGQGIPDSLQTKIFDPFFTTRSGGTGLGLAVVQNLVLSHGGEIHVSASSSGGAAFHIRFPLALLEENSPLVMQTQLAQSENMRSLP
jgi:two-component system sensor histidine kinase FlrB